MWPSVGRGLVGEGRQRGPDEAGELTGHGDDGLLGQDAAKGHLLVAAVQPQHGSIGEGDESRRLSLPTIAQRGADVGLVPVVPGGLDEEPSHVGVAGLGDGALAALVSRAAFAGNEPDEGHQPPGRGEAFEVVQLDGEADRGDRVDAAEAAQRGDGGGISRVESEAFEVDDQGLESLFDVVDGEEVVGRRRPSRRGCRSGATRASGGERGSRRVCPG